MPTSTREPRLRLLCLRSKALRVTVTCVVGAEQSLAAVLCCPLEVAQTGTRCLAAVSHNGSTHFVIGFCFHIANARNGTVPVRLQYVLSTMQFFTTFPDERSAHKVNSLNAHADATCRAAHGRTHTC